MENISNPQSYRKIVVDSLEAQRTFLKTEFDQIRNCIDAETQSIDVLTQGATPR